MGEVKLIDVPAALRTSGETSGSPAETDREHEHEYNRRAVPPKTPFKLPPGSCVPKFALTEAEQRRVLVDNPARLYGLDSPALESIGEPPPVSYGGPSPEHERR